MIRTLTGSTLLALGLALMTATAALAATTLTLGTTVTFVHGTGKSSGVVVSGITYATSCHNQTSSSPKTFRTAAGAYSGFNSPRQDESVDCLATVALPAVKGPAAVRVTVRELTYALACHESPLANNSAGSGIYAKMAIYKKSGTTSSLYDYRNFASKGAGCYTGNTLTYPATIPVTTSRCLAYTGDGTSNFSLRVISHSGVYATGSAIPATSMNATAMVSFTSPSVTFTPGGSC